MELPSRCSSKVFWSLAGCLFVTWISVMSIPGIQQCHSNPPICEVKCQHLDHGSLSKPLWSRAQQAEGGKCSTRDGHFEDDDLEQRLNASAWRQMKWIGKPAACRVRGELIERLDAVNNFRRGFALKFADNVEDRMHILPWLLGTRVDLNRSKRRVYLDLGSNTFQSSIQWFIQMYPCDFTEIHAFEIRPELLQIPVAFDERKNEIAENSAARRTKGRAGIPEWMLNRITVRNQLVSDEDDEANKKINITRFMKEELQLKADDTVVVKMDIEESEWPILSRWLNDSDMVDIVDEIFVEVHYKHPTMFDYNWNKFSHTRDEAKRLVADLRWKGFYIHFWP